jgi:hypothetical protein
LNLRFDFPVQPFDFLLDKHPMQSGLAALPSAAATASSSNRQLTPLAHSQYLNQSDITPTYSLTRGISTATSSGPSTWDTEKYSSVVLGKRPAQFGTGFAEPALPKMNPWKKRKTS